MGFRYRPLRDRIPMEIPDDLQAVFGNFGGTGLRAEEELIFSTKEGQAVLGTRNASLLCCYSGLYDYAVHNNVNLAKPTSVDDTRVGARLLSMIQANPQPESTTESDEIVNGKQPLSQDLIVSRKRGRSSGASSSNVSIPKKKVRLGSMANQTNNDTTRRSQSGLGSQRQRLTRPRDRRHQRLRRTALAKDKNALAVILGLAERCFVAANNGCDLPEPSRREPTRRRWTLDNNTGEVVRASK